MEKCRRDKVVKTYGRHKNRVIKTDIWDSEFNICRQNIFNVSSSLDDSDFVEAKKTKNGSTKRKKIKGANKENKIMTRKSKPAKKKRIDDNLFSEKEATSSFTDYGGGGLLKNLFQKNVPASAQKSKLGKQAKLRFEESQLQIDSKEQNMLINFNEFDNYKLCVSDSPVRANAKTTEASVPDWSDHLGKVLSPEIFSQNAKPSTQDNSFEPLSQKNGIYPKPKNSGITTSTPLGPFIAVSRLPNNTKNHRMSDVYSLFEQSHTDSSHDGQSSMTSLNDLDEIIRFSTPTRMASSSRPTKDNTTKNNSLDLSERSFDDSVLRLNPDLETDNSLNLSQRFEQIVSLRSKGEKSSSGKKQLSIETNDEDDNYRSNDKDVTENEGNSYHSEIFVCADCSLNNPCGDRCVYLDIKLSPDVCSVHLQKLEYFFDNLVTAEKFGELELSSLNFDGSQDLMESYSQASFPNHGMEERHDDEVGAISDIRGDLKLEKINKRMSSILLSDVDEEMEEDEDLISTSSGDDRTDVEDESGDISHPYECASPADHENVEQTTEVVNALMSQRTRVPSLTQNCTSPICTVAGMELTECSALSGSYFRSPYMTRRSKFQITVEDSKAESLSCTPEKGDSGSRSLKKNMGGDDETEEEDLISTSSGDDRTDEEDESGDISHLYECASPADHENVEQTTEVVNALMSLRTGVPSLTQNCTSPICTVAERELTDSSALSGSYVRSPYMTRSFKFLITVEDSKVESLSCTPEKGDSGCSSLKENMGGDDNDDDGNSSQVSPVMNVSARRKSSIAILSPKISCLSPRSKVLQQCEQDDFISFKNCITNSMMKKCVKIGEGAYGEVFRTKKKKQTVVLKIIPIEGDFEVNECLQKDFLEIVSEIVISKELSDLRNGIDDNTQNFVSVNSVSCLKGTYPAPLMREWDIFHKQKRSDNDRPDIFDKNQLFILFNFGDGGSALETFKFSNLSQAKSVLQQVAYGLAVAESALEFEHRDLHWGNVLVRPCPNEMLHFKLDGSDIHLPSWGIKVSIIDFTLSRLRKDGCTVFCDLAKDDILFEGKGDYQFDVYRLMREHTENQWERYCPKTNVFWIHYLADKLLKRKEYDENSSREDNEILRSLRQFVREVTDYTSAVNLVTTCPFMMASE